MRSRSSSRPLMTVILITTAVIAAACSSSSPSSAPTTSATPTTTAVITTTAAPTTTGPSTVAAAFNVRSSTRLVAITGAEPGQTLELAGPTGSSSGIVDELGNLIFREVDPGDGYVVADTGSSPTQVSDRFHVPTFKEIPEQSFYSSQSLIDGLNYIEMRDGVTLAAMVRLPGPAEDGPYPTVVEYSGYDPANPDEPEPMTGIFSQIGYATVGVNMRGSGCSGGAFDFFSELQTIDGYDMIETIAAQGWVLNNAVGMVGISYPGISQLFVAQTQPPSLEAISPMSVIEDSYRSVVYPGGIYNNGFAKSWGDSRQGSTDAYGQTWIQDRVDAGDDVCEANQLMRTQNVDLTTTAADLSFYTSDPGDRLAPRTFVDQINVPVFLAGAWQDEQTGPRFATMLDSFTGTDVVEIHLYNGAHADSANPEVLGRLFEFMDVYVAHRAPVTNPLVRFGAPLLYESVYGVAGLTLPPDRFTSLDEAKSTIESEQPVTLMLEMGGDPDTLGAPVPRSELKFDSWPPPAAQPQRWALAPGGLLVAPGDGAVPGEADESFVVDVDRSQVVTPSADDGNDNEFDDLVWPALEEGTYLGYATKPLTEDLVLAGSGHVSLWVRSSAVDADLQVSITELRPDGQEMYVQSGWLRASHRTLGAQSTDLLPFQTHSEADASPLPADEFTLVEIEIFPVAHVFRAGSSLRLIVDNPGGNRNLWKFDVLPNDGETISVGMGGATLSELVLPFLTGVDVADGLTPCGSTRSQPCRPIVGEP